MEIYSIEFLTALLSIIIIDLVLAGDNALLIGMVAKNIPEKDQRKVIFLGAIGAIGIRILFTIIAVRLLEINGLLLVGGVLLMYISIKLILSENETDIHPAKRSFWGAIGTILLADFLMGIDNIIAVAGAAQGEYLLVVIGLIISIPLIIWGSTLVIRLIDRFPIVIFIGAGILAWTAAKMIVNDVYVTPYINGQSILLFELLTVSLVLSIGYISKRVVRTKTGNVKIQ